MIRRTEPSAFELEDHRTVVVPVDAECLGRMPGRVQVGLDVRAEVPLQGCGEVLNTGVELVDRVQDQGGAVGDLAVKARGFDAVADLGALGDRGVQVLVRRDLLPVVEQAQVRGVEPVAGQQVVQVVPREQAAQPYGGL